MVNPPDMASAISSHRNILGCLEIVCISGGAFCGRLRSEYKGLEHRLADARHRAALSSESVAF
jgi:hypothetical protein